MKAVKGFGAGSRRTIVFELARIRLHEHCHMQPAAWVNLYS